MAEIHSERGSGQSADVLMGDHATGSGVGERTFAVRVDNERNGLVWDKSGITRVESV